MNKQRLLLLFPLAVVTLCIAMAVHGVRKVGIETPPAADVHQPTNAVYYWRTTFNPSQYETAFLRKNKIGRMYLRMFDVVEGSEMPEPNATIRFLSKPVADIEIVPTVFVTVEAMSQAAEASDGIKTLARKIVKRISAMCSWNDIANWHEIQLDCDWTASTQQPFYSLCKEVKGQIGEKLLSSTIRLHQLTQPAPPVDYGVLMIYNTDSFQDYDSQNSILNNTTVEKFLSKELKCKLPLDIALPVFQWDVIFRNGVFDRIAYWVDIPDSMEEKRHEQVPYSELLKTQRLAAKYLHLQSGKHSVILYHLDERNLNNYSDEEFKSLYRH